MKDEILKSALQIADRDGWEQVSTRRITKEFGYTTSAIYHYLGGKDELLTELQRQGFVKLKTVTHAAAMTQPSDSQAQLRAISLAFWTFAHENRRLYELMFGLAQVNCHGPSGDEVRQAGAVVQEVLQRLSAKPFMSLFLNWWALVSGFVAISFTSPAEANGYLQQAFQDSVERFLSSL